MMLTPVRILLLLVALLSAGLASLWVDPQGHWRNIAWKPPEAKSPDVSSPAGLMLVAPGEAATAYASIQARPLFAPDRRPPPPPPPPVPPPPPDPLADIQLYGVFSGESAGIVARVEGKMRRIKVNEALGEWTLKNIDGRTVTFAKGDEKRQLKLAYAPLGARVPPAPTAAQPSAGRAPGTSRNAAAAQNSQDEARETLRRRNEIRAARGLPPVTE